jgi:hypothetical protein
VAGRHLCHPGDFLDIVCASSGRPKTQKRCHFPMDYVIHNAVFFTTLAIEMGN